MRSHADAVQQQFDPQARVYLTSAVHAAGPDLEQAARLIAPLAATGSALDVGCGAGHLAFALAGHFARVTASDPSPAMLATVAEAARERGVGGRIATCLAGAEALPFDTASFDVVATRYSAHHWLDLDAALRELRRVLRPGGRLLVIDVLGDESALVDTHLQALELLRDPSHVRNRPASEWRRLLAGAGFELHHATSFALRLDFTSWIARMRTPADSVAALRRLQDGAPRQVAQGLAFEADGSFGARTGLFWAGAASPAG